MTEDQAREVELIRAVELEDRESLLLTAEDRATAEAQARRAGGTESFIVHRANFLATRLSTRNPGIAKLLGRTRWPRAVGIVLPAIALVSGFAANELGTGKRLDLLALPLLGTVAWNLLVYLLLLGAIFKRKRTAEPGQWQRLMHRSVGLGRAVTSAGPTGTPIERAAALFVQRWTSASSALTGARLARTLHLSAALFALGLIAGIYSRALVIEYRAGWESTFLEPASVRALLSVVLGPASALTGVALPGVDGIAAMRWTGPVTGGVNAAPWILLYTVTVAGLVIVPRLLLAAGSAAAAAHRTRKFPGPGREDFYVRRLLRDAGGVPARVRITPYAYRPDMAARTNLVAALRAALGSGAQARFDEAVDYGAEDRFAAELAGDPADDLHLLLFTLSATPEEENHGHFAAEIVQRMARDCPGTIVAAIVDETPFRAHFTGQPGLSERVATRLQGWSRALAASSLPPVGIDLAQAQDPALARRLESALIADGALR